MRALIYLLFFFLLIHAAHAKEVSDNDDVVTFKDFTYYI